MQEYLLRRACDRCHTQKLRCEREGDVCARCARAGVPCVWSPSLRKQPVRRSESRSPTSEFHDASAGVKKRRLVAPSLSPSSYSSIQGHLINDQRSHHNEFDVRDPRARQGAPAFERPQHTPQTYTDFDYGFIPAHSSVNSGIPFEAVQEPAQYWSNVPPDASIGWTPTYVSSIDSTSTASTATDPSLYSAVALSHQTTPIPYQPGSMAAPTSTVRHSRENSQPRPVPPQLAVNTAISKQPISIVQNLSLLNVQMHENAARITAQKAPKSGQSQSRTQRSRSTSVAGYNENNSASLEEDLAIDETFQLSLDFIDALSGQGGRLDAFSSPAHRNRARSVSTISPAPAMQVQSSTTEFLEIPQPAVDSNSEPAPRFEDQASVLLILSCYLRLINTYDDVFEHIQAVLEWQNQTDLHRLRLKRISVGDFSPPKDSLAHANLVLQMSEHLLTCVRDKVKNAAACEDDHEGHIVREEERTEKQEESPDPIPNDVTKMTLLAIKVREMNIINKLKRIRQNLHQPSIFL